MANNYGRVILKQTKNQEILFSLLFSTSFFFLVNSFSLIKIINLHTYLIVDRIKNCRTFQEVSTRTPFFPYCNFLQFLLIIFFVLSFLNNAPFLFNQFRQRPFRCVHVRICHKIFHTKPCLSYYTGGGGGYQFPATLLG